MIFRSSILIGIKLFLSAPSTALSLDSFTFDEYTVINHNQSPYVASEDYSKLAIVAKQNTLFANKILISPINRNSVSGRPTFPDSVWSGFRIEPVLMVTKNAVKLRSQNSALFECQKTFPYALCRPVIRSIAEGGIRSLVLKCDGLKDVSIELYNDLLPEYALHSGSSNDHNIVVQVADDTMRIYSNTPARNGNLVFTSPTSKGKYSEREVDTLYKTLLGIKKADSATLWIGVDPHPMLPFEKIMQIFNIADKVNRNNAVHGVYNKCLYGVFSPWNTARRLSRSHSKLDTNSCTPIGLSIRPDISPQWPVWARSQNVSAIVDAEITLDSSGEASKIDILHSAGEEFDDSVISAINATKFPQCNTDKLTKPLRFQKTFRFIQGKSPTFAVETEHEIGKIKVFNNGAKAKWDGAKWMSI